MRNWHIKSLLGALPPPYAHRCFISDCRRLDSQITTRQSGQEVSCVPSLQNNFLYHYAEPSRVLVDTHELWHESGAVDFDNLDAAFKWQLYLGRSIGKYLGKTDLSINDDANGDAKAIPPTFNPKMICFDR